MASAKKQEHLEAGKRRLEEFRKKKAAERVKKTANNLPTATVNDQNKQPVHYQHEALKSSNEAVTSSGLSEVPLERSQVVVEENRAIDFIPNSEIVSTDVHTNPTYNNTFSTEIAQSPIENKEIDRYDGTWSSKYGNINSSSSPYEKNDYGVSAGVSGRHDYGFPSNQSVDYITSDHSSHGHLKAYSEDTDKQVMDLPFSRPASSSHVIANVSGDDSVNQLKNNYSYGRLLDTGMTLSSNEDSVYSSSKTSASFPQVWQNNHDVVEPSNSSISSVGERKLNDYFGNLPSGNSTSLWPTESRSTASTTGLNFPSYLPVQTVAEPKSTRSRPSFLDSINLSRAEPEKGDSLGPNVHDMGVFPSKTESPYGAGAFDQPPASLASSAIGHDIYKGVNNNNIMERENFFNSQKQDEDFAALEQHIEDLTQEKFALQRALEASRTLSDSLAAENSSLTDSYNQQGSIVYQLKSDIEMLHEEIKSHMAELEAVKMEYGNAQLECTAADDRAKLLASEVISLEEKTLKLRSSELKLERQLENAQSELSSLKRKLSSLEKDRQDLQSTIDALREEKKLLQAKLRKSSGNGKSLDIGKSLDNKKNVSTSTEDLVHMGTAEDAAGTATVERDNAAHLLETDSFPFLLPENGQFNLEFASSRIPSDQLRMIQNINTLVSELALEKEGLVQALAVESSESSKLKELNKELTRKLEVQTQRLELLTAQSLSNKNFPNRQLDLDSMTVENTQYADEGDEVVERVLGWIMKLFPGGPSRRRTSSRF